MCFVLDDAFVPALELHTRRSAEGRLTLLTTPVALLMGEDERPAGPFNDMLGVVVEKPAGARGATKAVHDDDASTTRAVGRAEERTILERGDKESVSWGSVGNPWVLAVLQNYRRSVCIGYRDAHPPPKSKNQKTMIGRKMGRRNCVQDNGG